MKGLRRHRRPKPLRFEEKFSRDRDFFGSREKKSRPPRRRYLLLSLCCLGGALLFLGVYLLSGLWKVTEVTAGDGTHYSAAVVLEYADVQAGDEMLGFDASAVVRRLKEGLPLLDTVKVRKHLNGRVTITCTEETDLFYTRHNGNYYIISEKTHKVLCVSSQPTEARRVGAIYLGIPEATRVRVGEELRFINLPYEPDSAPQELVTYEVETGEPEEEYRYVFDFVETLMGSSLASRVIGMELGDRYDLWLVLDGSIKVRIGNMDELERKLTVTERSLADRLEEGFDPGGLPTLVDVSDPARIIHRTSPDIPMPDWAKELT